LLVNDWGGGKNCLGWVFFYQPTSTWAKKGLTQIPEKRSRPECVGEKMVEARKGRSSYAGRRCRGETSDGKANDPAGSTTFIKVGNSYGERTPLFSSRKQD